MNTIEITNTIETKGKRTQLFRLIIYPINHYNDKIIFADGVFCSSSLMKRSKNLPDKQQAGQSLTDFLQLKVLKNLNRLKLIFAQTLICS
jgi:hypothetical protein